MSEVINPPEYYFTGIDFNPAFYAEDAGGISQETANALYLRKTVPDTATAIETFNLGIKAQKVDGLLSSSIMYVGNNITTGSLLLGNLGIRTKNQGIFETSSIRTSATNGQLTICTDATAGGTVEIGTSASTTTINGTAKANAIEGILTTGDQSFFTTKTANNLNVFASSGSTAVLNVKGSGIKFDTLSTDAPTGNQGLYTNKTSGTLSIATNQTAGSINIGGLGSFAIIGGTLIVPNNLNFLGTDGFHKINSTGSNMIFTEYGVSSPTWSFYNSATSTTVATINTIGVYATLSDRNKKKDFEPSTLGLNEILQLKPTLFRYKNKREDKEEEDKQEPKSIGFIAQEVQSVLPQAYIEGGTFIGLDHNAFIPVLVKAVQEMKQDYDAKLKFQETKFANLEARLLALETKPPHVEVTDPLAPQNGLVEDFPNPSETVIV
jgi:hypothetical protein